MTTVDLEQQRLLIGGEWVEASGGGTFERSDPSTGGRDGRGGGRARGRAAGGRGGARRVPRLAGTPAGERRALLNGRPTC